MTRWRSVARAPEYKTMQVNDDVFRLTLDRSYVGQVRRGLDGLWYPELPAERSRAAAMHRLTIAHAATVEFLQAVTE